MVKYAYINGKEVIHELERKLSMNRIIALILSIILVISLAACSTATVKEDKGATEVVVFAAASMTE